MSRTLALACALLFVAPLAVAQTVHPLLVSQAFLHVDPLDTSTPAIPISLAALGIGPGYVIRLATVGDWDAGPGGDLQTNLLAVFSSNSTLLAPSARARVPGAISCGLTNFSGGTFPGNEPTDIPEDFLVTGTGVDVTVPTGAAYLFATVADIYYVDNSDPDGDLGIRITVVSTDAPPTGPRSVALAAAPNPARHGSMLSFELATGENAQLTLSDVNGRLVRTLHSGMLPAGRHAFAWDGRDAAGRNVPPGVYLARLQAGARVWNARLVVVR